MEIDRKNSKVIFSIREIIDAIGIKTIVDEVGVIPFLNEIGTDDAREYVALIDKKNQPPQGAAK